MSVYDKNAFKMNTAYSIDGTLLSQAYDVNGNPLLSGLEDLVPDRLLVWHDEFEGETVDPSKWSHLFGYYNGNRYYMLENDLAHNAFCQDGVLHITNQRDSIMPNTKWTGAFIHTNNIFEFRYGLIEAKIKYPTNTNVYHSTLWTLGANYERISNANTQGDQTKGVLFCTCGEIDIAEADNGGVFSVVHWAVPSTNQTQSSSSTTLTSTANQWHIYGCEWTNESINFYIDRILRGSVSVNSITTEGFNALRLPHFLMFNQNPYLNGVQTEDYLETLVDWVRVYAPVGVTDIVEETGISVGVDSLSLSVGETYLLTGEFTPSNPSDMTLLWHSDNENVAICYGGKITAIAAGVAHISCTTKHGHTATCTVTVS